MQPISKKDKRAGIRVPLLSERAVYILNGVEKAADVSDITSEGLFLRTDEILKPHQELTLKMNLPGDLGTLEIEALVARVNWTVSRKKKREFLGMGLRFTNVTQSIQKILDAYVVYLRNKQIITVSKRIIEEFFGNEGPKKYL